MMFAKLSAVLTLVLLPLAGAACENDAAQQELRDLINYRDVRAIEASLSAHQDAFEHGERAADEMRCLFTQFTYIRPRMFEVVDLWREKHPTSPYAKVAKAWTLHSLSWQLRGGDYAGKTYGEALANFSEMQAMAWALANAAYTERPRLIPASDAVILLANPNRGRGKFWRVLDDVMASDPNDGTIVRAAGTVIPGWRWSFEDGARLCDTYAPLIPNADEKAATRCRLMFARRYDAQRQWVHDQLATGDYPAFDEYRIPRLLHAGDRKSLELVHEILSRTGFRREGSLWDYDSLALQAGLPLMTEVVDARRHAWAREELARSPYSVEALKILLRPKVASRRGENGRLQVYVLEEPSDEEAKDFALRWLVASPYDAEAWDMVHSILGGLREFDRFGDDEAFLVNEVVVANHSPEALTQYVMQKIYAFDAMRMVDQGEITDAHAERFFRDVPIEDVLCPAVRAQRLLEWICTDNDDFACQHNAQYDGMIDLLMDRVKEERICWKERTLPAITQGFLPQQVPERYRRDKY